MDHLILIGEAAVKERRRRQNEHGKGKSDRARLKT